MIEEKLTTCHLFQKLKKKLVIGVVNTYTKNRIAYFDSSMEKSQKSQENAISSLVQNIVTIKTLVIKQFKHIT